MESERNMNREQYMSELYSRWHPQRKNLNRHEKNAAIMAIRRGYPTKTEDALISRSLDMPSFYSIVDLPAEKEGDLGSTVPLVKESRADSKDIYLNYALREARRAVSYTAKKLSSLSGVNPISLYFFERLRAMPNEGDAEKIANALNVGLVFALGERNSKKVTNGDLERIIGSGLSTGFTAEYLFPKEMYQVAREIRKERMDSEEDLSEKLGLMQFFDPTFVPRSILDIPSEEISPEKNVENVMIRRELSEALYEIGDRERMVLELRHGLGKRHNFSPMSLDEVGRYMKLSRERIRQIEENALTRLRRVANRMGLIRLDDHTQTGLGPLPVKTDRFSNILANIMPDYSLVEPN